MSKITVIQTDNSPSAIGPYSQGIRVNDTVYLSGQIPLDPQTMELASSNFAEQAEQVFVNLTALAKEAGGSLENIVKLTIYLTDLAAFSQLNELMSKHFKQPYPARVTVEVSALPKQSQ